MIHGPCGGSLAGPRRRSFFGGGGGMAPQNHYIHVPCMRRMISTYRFYPRAYLHAHKLIDGLVLKEVTPFFRFPLDFMHACHYNRPPLAYALRRTRKHRAPAR